MRVKSLLAGIAAIPLLAGPTVALAPAGPAHAGCVGTMVFEVGGMWDPTASVYQPANGHLPAGYGATRIHYPAQIWPMPESQGSTVESTHTLDQSVAIGMDHLGSAVDTFHADCPGSHILISGYSEGALVAGNMLGRLSTESAIPHGQLAGVLYADARRPAAGTGQGGIETNIPTFMDGMTMQGPRGFGDLRVHEICNQNDGICNSANPITNLLEFANGVAGYLTGAHGYRIDPVADQGDGDTVIPQAPIIGYGPPLPINSPTPWQLYNGKLPTSQIKQIVAHIADLVYGVLPGSLKSQTWRLPQLFGAQGDPGTPPAG